MPSLARVSTLFPGSPSSTVRILALSCLRSQATRPWPVPIHKVFPMGNTALTDADSV